MSILLSMFALILMVSLLWVILAGLFGSMRLTEKNFQFALIVALAICLPVALFSHFVPLQITISIAPK